MKLDMRPRGADGLPVTGIPEGYIPGQDRDTDRGQRTHLYKGDFNDPGLPMCHRGWNRDNGQTYSIWRNNIGKGGVCKTCLRRARAGLDGVQPKSGRPDPTLDKVLYVLRGLRVQPVSLEYDLQAHVATLLDTYDIPYTKEHRLGPRNRIDFLVAGGIGIEVKKGKPNAGQVAAQVQRYCGHDEIKALVLVVEQNLFNHLEEANGKPVRYVALNKQWGIAL